MLEMGFVSTLNKKLCFVFQVRNLCYMVTRREKMKHTLCDLQEKIFHLQIQLLEEDIAGGKREKNPVIWTHQCKNPLPLTHCSTVAKAANTHSVHLKKKKKRVKLKYITVTFKPSLTECSGWTVLEMARHHFCTAGHTWHLHSKEQWNNSSVRYCGTHRPRKWSSISYPLCTDDWPQCISCSCSVMESKRDETGCWSWCCCVCWISPQNEIYNLSGTTKLNGFSVYSYAHIFYHSF